MGRVLTSLKNAVYPRRCPACHDAVRPFGAAICEGCRSRFTYVKGPFCARCGKELADEEGQICEGCRRIDNGLSGGAALFHYNETARASMGKFKYEGRCEYADFYAEELAARYREKILSWKPQRIVPVPVHKSRLKERGYNQAAELALRLGKALDIPVDLDLLKREKRTAAQKELGAGERAENLKGAFTASRSAEGLSAVLLVDDIYTTGLTMKNCAEALKAAGVKKVYGCAVCISEDY